jgi:hypothetical protein
VLSTTAVAQTVQTFTTSQSGFDPGVKNQGWWSSTVPNIDSNDNYFVGEADRLRNFFTFDLSAACPATSVTLQLTRFEQSGPLPYSLFDVTTPAATLNDNDLFSTAIYNDLGSGTKFGSFLVVQGAAADVLSFELNAAGVAAFNAARGGFFSIGGSAPVNELGFIYAFSGPGAGGTQQLLVTCLPSSKDECKNGAWRSYDVFKNQGDCISFVATGGKNQPAGL